MSNDHFIKYKPFLSACRFHQWRHSIPIQGLSFTEVHNIKYDSLKKEHRDVLDSNRNTSAHCLLESKLIQPKQKPKQKTWSCFTFSTVKLNHTRKRGLHVSGRIKRSYSYSVM